MTSTHLFPSDPILLVDDQKDVMKMETVALQLAGITNVEQCSESTEVRDRLAGGKYAAVLLDLYMPRIAGWELLPPIARDHPDTPVIVITAADELAMAVNCMKMGAVDYLVKPVDTAQLVTTVQRALALSEMEEENQRLKDGLLAPRVDHPEILARLHTRNPRMLAVYRYMEILAPSSRCVLITGETGVGKEVMARCLHDLSSREGAFVSVNVAGLDDTLFSDTIFGHRKGAFTGADAAREGLIRKAAAGTLFLDEIGDLAVESQVKILRLLQEHEYYPLGSDTPQRTNARFVFATNRDLPALMAADRFRKDLFYRLKAHLLPIPPLRERPEDIEPLVRHFLVQAASELERTTPTPPRELFPLLRGCGFPGNIRELEGVVFDAVMRHGSGVLSLDTFRALLPESRAATGGSNGAPEAEDALHTMAMLPTMKELEHLLVAEALRRAENNQGTAAQILGLSRQALNNRLQREKTRVHDERDGEA
jgi:two-component system, NtrC family, response regulator HydG